MDEEIIYKPRKKYFTPLEESVEDIIIFKPKKYYTPLEEITSKPPSPSKLPIPTFSVSEKKPSPIKSIQEKVLGVGTYGCTFYPAKSCDPGNKQLDNKVGKVFYDEESWDQEKIENEKIRKVDPEGKFTLLSNIPNNSCKINRKLYNLAECKDEMKWGPDQPYYQIIYNMGGKDLESIMKDPKNNLFNHNDSTLKFSYVKYFNSFKPILEGFNREAWKNESIAHTDIKGLNITVKDDGKGNLIDFGLMMPCKQIYSKDAKVDMNGGYMYWPADFNIFFNIMKKFNVLSRRSGLNLLIINNQIRNIINNINTNDDYYVSLIDSLTISPEQFMNYYELIPYGTTLLSAVQTKVENGEFPLQTFDILAFNSDFHLNELINAYTNTLYELKEQLLKVKSKDPSITDTTTLNPDFVNDLLAKIFIKKCNNIDIYMLGLAMLAGLVLAYKSGKLPLDNRFNEAIDYISYLINFNMYQRYSPEQALSDLNEIIESLNKVEDIDLSTLRGGGFTRKIKFIHGLNSKKQIKNRKNKSNKNKNQRQTKRKNKYLNKNKRRKTNKK